MIEIEDFQLRKRFRVRHWFTSKLDALFFRCGGAFRNFTICMRNPLERISDTSFGIPLIFSVIVFLYNYFQQT